MRATPELWTDNNFRRNGLLTLRPSVEALREFNIQTNLFAAEQGRNPRATVNVVTKSGSNQRHGSANELFRTTNSMRGSSSLPRT